MSTVDTNLDVLFGGPAVGMDYDMNGPIRTKYKLDESNWKAHGPLAAARLVTLVRKQEDHVALQKEGLLSNPRGRSEHPGPEALADFLDAAGARGYDMASIEQWFREADCDLTANSWDLLTWGVLDKASRWMNLMWKVCDRNPKKSRVRLAIPQDLCPTGLYGYIDSDGSVAYEEQLPPQTEKPEPADAEPQLTVWERAQLAKKEWQERRATEVEPLPVKADASEIPIDPSAPPTDGELGGEPMPDIDWEAIRAENFPWVPGHWEPKTVEDMDKVANWYAQCEEEEERIKAQAKVRMAQVEQRRKYLDWKYKQALEAWTRANLTKGRRSVDLPSARLQLRKLAAHWKIADDDLLRGWCSQQTPEIQRKLKIEQVTTYKWADIKLIRQHADMLKSCGKIPPGLEWVPEEDKFSVVLPRREE